MHITQAKQQSLQPKGTNQINWQQITASIMILSGTSLLWTGEKSWATGASEISDRIPNKNGALIQNQVAQIQIPVVPFDLQNTPSQRTEPNPQFRPYRLGPLDSISVVVQPPFTELSGTFAIDAEGKILLPLVGKLQIAGFTPEEAQEKIRAAYNRFVVNPKVTVSLAAPRPGQITITGEIVRPGFYPFGFGSRLSNALIGAGGTTTNADLRTILIRRFLSDGSYIEQRMDLFTPLVAGDPVPDLFLQDGDAIIVPKLEVGNEATYDRQLVARSTLVKPTITIRVLRYPGGIGLVTLPNGSSFLDAVTALGVSPETSDVGNIALLRFDPERGKPIVRELNAKRALFGEVAQNVPLRENDVIVVGRTFVERLRYGITTLTQPFNDVLQFFDFVRSLTERFNDIFVRPRN